VTLESAGNLLSRTPFCSAKWLEREQEQEQEQEPGKSGGGKNRHQEQEEAPGARTGASSEGTQLEWGSCGRVPHGWGAAAKGDLRGPASDTRTAMKEGESEVQQHRKRGPDGLQRGGGARYAIGRGVVRPDSNETSPIDASLFHF
jgi:hypothetical protein